MKRSFLKTLAATLMTCAGLSGLHAQDHFFAPTNGAAYDTRIPTNQPGGRYDQRLHEQRQLQQRPVYRPTGLNDPFSDSSPNAIAPGGCIGGRCHLERGDRANGTDQTPNPRWRNNRRDANGSRHYQTRLAENSGWDTLNDVVPHAGGQHYSGDGHNHGGGMGRLGGPGHRGGRCGNGQCRVSNLDCDCPTGQCDCGPNPRDLHSNYRHPRPNGYDGFNLTRRSNTGPYAPVLAPYTN